MATKLHVTIRVIALVLWLIASAYGAWGGWLTVDLEAQIRQRLEAEPAEEEPVVVDGVEFATVEDAQLAIAQRQVHRVFPWTRVLGGTGGLIVFAACFGALGGVLGLLKQRILDERRFDDLPVFLAPVFSALLGCLLLGVVIALPTLLTTSTEVEPRPLTVLILCLLGGAMSDRLYQWFEQLFSKIFGPAKDGGDEE